MCKISLWNPHGRYSRIFPLLPVDGSPLGKQICCWWNSGQILLCNGLRWHLNFELRPLHAFLNLRRSCVLWVTLITMQSWNIMSDLKAGPRTYVLKKCHGETISICKELARPACFTRVLSPFCMCNVYVYVVCMGECTPVRVCMCTCVYVYVEPWFWWQDSSSITLHFIYWARVPHVNPSLTIWLL